MVGNLGTILALLCLCLRDFRLPPPTCRGYDVQVFLLAIWPVIATAVPVGTVPPIRLTTGPSLENCCASLFQAVAVTCQHLLWGADPQQRALAMPWAQAMGIHLSSRFNRFVARARLDGFLVSAGPPSVAEPHERSNP